MKNTILLAVFLFTASLLSGQSINVSLSTLDFEQVFPGYYSRVQTYQVSASNLNGTLNITAPPGYELSQSCHSAYDTMITLSPGGGNVNSTKIYVRFYPKNSGTFSGDIVHQSNGATDVQISVNETTGSSNMPQAYYSSATASGKNLKTQLFNIVDNHTVRSYGDLWNDYQTTDDKPNGKVWDMYTDNGGCKTNPVEFTFISDQCGNYSTEGDCYNREHSFPKSWFNDASPMYTDLYQVVPSDGYNNGMRANYPYGEVTSANYTTANGSRRGNSAISAYSGTVFEPADIYKGDFARIYFYMATRYENKIASWENYSSYGDAILDGSSFPCYEPWQLDMLVKWHLNDPVSQKEIKRNDEVYAIQGNRNPYVDHPEYVMKVWGNQLSVKPEPANYPQNFKAEKKALSDVKVTWADATGMVVPDGYLIKANTSGAFTDPADGTTVAEDLNIADGDALVRVSQGKEQYTFSGADTLKTYHFKIWSYTNNGFDIDYKTSPIAPADSIKFNVGIRNYSQKENFISGLVYTDNGLTFKSFSQTKLNIQVFSLSGQLIQQEKYPAGKRTINLKLSNFSHNMLLIKIANEKDQLKRKYYHLK